MKNATPGQSYKHFTIVNCDSRVIPDFKIPHVTTLESQFTSVKYLKDWAPMMCLGETSAWVLLELIYISNYQNF